MLLFMGIDPGLNNTGVGVVGWERGKLHYISHSLIKPPTKAPLSERLGVLAKAIVYQASQYDLCCAAVEDVFYSVNARSALLLGQARGAIMAGLALQNIKVCEYTALQIKQAVVGYGQAEKEQVKKMVEMQLNKSFNGIALDVTDALACAICVAISETNRMNSNLRI